MNNFSDWLLSEMKSRGLSQSELARKANVSQAAISHILSDRRNPGNDLCEALARVFGYPPETVYRAAGILPQLPADDAEWEEWRYELKRLTPEQRIYFRQQIRAVADYEDEQRRLQETIKRKKTGPLPNL